MQVNPYLSFNGRCEEAIDFYRGALGAEVVMMMRFKDCPVSMEPGQGPPSPPEKIMHVSFRVGESTLMASDSRCQGNPTFQGVSLSISLKDDAEAEKVFAALSDGGQVQMPLNKTFFASKFGMLVDRFGVSWMIVAGTQG